MHKALLALASFLLVITVYGQDKLTDLIRQNSYPIRSISITDTDYSDLQPIADAIGNARIVMLGEMDNGDGETFKAKARLIRFLHQKMGFTVLAFEADFYATNFLWDRFRNPERVLEAVWEVWTETMEFKDTRDYIMLASKAADTLQLAGFDSQVFHQPTIEHFYNTAPAFFTRLGYAPADPSVKNYLLTLLRANDYDTVRKGMPDTTITFLRDYTAKILDQIDRNPGVDPGRYYSQCLNSLMGNALNCYRNRSVPVGYNFFRIQFDGTIHDLQMASNLSWLARQKYPGRKIIVWSNNQHISKNTDGIDVELSDYRKTQRTTLGNEMVKNFGDSVFSLAFSSSDGTSGSPFQRNLKPFPIKPTNGKDLYSRTLSAMPHNFAFTNFRRLQSSPAASSSFIMRGWGYPYPMEGQWFKAFDGIFYIRNNKAATATEMIEYE